MSKLTKILLIIGIFDLAFIITMIYVYLTTGQEMVTLTTCVLGASGIEAIVSAAIKISNIYNNEDKSSKKPLTQGDITGFDDAEVLDKEQSNDSNNVCG